MESKPREFWIFKVGKHSIIVDYEMVPILKLYTWHVRPDKKNFYAYTNVKVAGKNFLLAMHRLLTGMKESQIDHINRNGLDNRTANLRYASNKQNSCNRVRWNSLGYRGVYRHKNKFACQIQFNGTKYGKTGFTTAVEAAREYDKLSKGLHGEFGIRNFKD